MNKPGKVTYTYINHKIHYFKSTDRGSFALDELDPLPEAVTDPLPNELIDDDNSFNPNDQIIEIPNNETNKSTNNHNNNNNTNLVSFIKAERYKLVIAMAMYAEEFERIETTLEGISENLPELVKAGISQEKILILIISDGREKVNKEVFEKFTENKLETKEELIDIYMKKEIFSSKDYEYKKPNYLISCVVKREKIFDYSTNKKTQMDILFSIKKENRGKLDSHYWLFAGFCQQINPDYIILLDTGTTPDLERGLALSSLILPMENDPKIAGTCGEMELDNNYNCTNLTICAQFLEYKYAHVVDKNFESLFGFISVLPGAFSAYRWTALNHSSTLSEYFLTIGNERADCSMANRYLAEDRIFCWVLFAMKEQANILRFIPDAKAKTDAPEFFGEFILQRRRWINGSNFAMYYVLGKYAEICQTKHSLRQFFFLLLYFYYVIQALLGYFSLGTFYFIYYMICEKNFKKDSVTSNLIMSIYLFVVIFTIIASLTVKPIRVVSFNKSNKRDEVKFKRRTIYFILSFVMGIYNLFAFILGIYTIFNGGFNNPDKAKFSTVDEYYQAYKEYWGALILSIISLGNFLLPLLYQPTMIPLWITTFFQYLLFQPTYSIILNIFAVCNIDDVSWGNRDSNAHMSDDNFKKYKLKYLTSWLVMNFIIGWGFSYIVTNPQSIIDGNDKKLINFYSILVATLTAFKLTGAMLGKLKFYLYDKKFKKMMQNKNNNVQSVNNQGIINTNNAAKLAYKPDYDIVIQSEKEELQNKAGMEVANFAVENKNNDKWQRNNDNDIEIGIVSRKDMNHNSHIDIHDIDLNNEGKIYNYKNDDGENIN